MIKYINNMKHRSYNILGNIAIVNFPKDFSSAEKKKFAEKILQTNKEVKTVLEKSGKFKGRLRKMQTKYIAGEKTKEVLYKESNCVFRFNIDTSYFSPRLSNERKEIASQIKKDDEVLVMFAGVGPLPIVIGKNSKPKLIISNELNREANKYAKLNIERNKLKEKIILAPGDIKKVAPKLKKKFSIIVMPRPQLKDSFLEQAFMLSKKNTKIFYYDFCDEDKTDLIVKKIQEEAKQFKKKIKVLKIKKAGEIAPYKIRCRVDFVVL